MRMRLGSGSISPVTAFFNLLANLLGLSGVVALVQTGLDVYSLTGAQALIASIFPVLLLAEIGFLLYTYRAVPGTLSRALKLPLLVYATHAIVAAFLFVDVLFATEKFFAPFAPCHVPVNLLGFLYAYVVWELGHFLSHWSCHRVRLLWCLHAPHHAPAT
jgi:sterol desaturase/sphingolipid hydroxylase (fatty acid hydroxylase superfamily)